MTDEQRDVIEVLEHDHREVEQMFAELESLRGASSDDARSRRKELAEQVTIELVRHSVAEEVLVYPQAERKLSEDEVEHAREEHAEAERTLQRLEKLDADDPNFDDELSQLMREIRHHIEDEEGQMFAHMREVIDEDELRELVEDAWRMVVPKSVAAEHLDMIECGNDQHAVRPRRDRPDPGAGRPARGDDAGGSGRQGDKGGDPGDG